jgi:hypothetical protein
VTRTAGPRLAGPTFARGPNAGMQKTTQPTLQPRRGFAGAVLSAMRLREMEPMPEVAVVVPDWPPCRKLSTI